MASLTAFFVTVAGISLMIFQISGEKVAESPVICEDGEASRLPIRVNSAGTTIVGEVSADAAMGNETFLTNSGCYFLPSPADGRMTSMRVFGYLSRENVDRVLSQTALFALYAIVYRQAPDSALYSLVHGPVLITHGLGSNATEFDFPVRRDDLIGVLIPEECTSELGSPNLCPSQVNLYGESSKCYLAFFHPANSKDNLGDINASELQKVEADLSIEIDIVSDPGSTINSTALLVVTLVIIVALLVAVGGLVCWIIVTHVRASKSSSSVKAAVGGSKDLEASHVSAGNGVTFTAVSQSVRDSKLGKEMILSKQESSQGYVEITEAQDEAAKSDGCQVLTDEDSIAIQNDGYDRVGEEDDESQSDNGYDKVSNDEKSLEDDHSYDPVCDDELLSSIPNEYEDDFSPELKKELEGKYNVEPYFKPASEEEDVMIQLENKLRVHVIPQEELTLHGELGSGEFGKVYRGVWSHTAEGSKDVMEEEVAVKTMRGEATKEEKIKFLQEAAIVAQFKHNFVIGMRGLVMDSTVMIVMELMKGGDLREYLHTTMRKRVETLDPLEAGSILLSYTRQLSLGMYCFARKSYIHRDFAARNVLMSKDGVTCKIADFGLSQELQGQDHFVASGGKIPVKWTAPEALLYRRYSTASDVWSFGCVLYEIWSLGEKPFQELTNQQAIKRVVAGHRLTPPPGCPRTIYNIMMQCWHPKAEDRPIFCAVMQELQKSDCAILKWSAKEKKMYSPEARKLGAPLEHGRMLYKDLQRMYLKSKEK